MIDPYAPPAAELADPPKPGMAAWKALLVGLGIDIGGSMLAGILMAVVFAVVAATNNQFSARPAADPAGMATWLSLLSLGGRAVAAGFSLLGGRVTTRLARRSDYRLGFLLAGLSAGISLLTGSGQPAGAMVVRATVTVAAILLGTRLGQVKPSVLLSTDPA
jgi:hypothetical protein